MWDLSSPTRDWTRVPCMGRRIPSPWTTREAHWQEFCSHSFFFTQHIYFMLILFLTCCLEFRPLWMSGQCPPFPCRPSFSFALPSPGTHACHLQERTSSVALSSSAWLRDYILFCFCSWWEELFTFPQEALLLRWENTLLGQAPPERPSPAWRKTRHSLWWGVVCSLSPCNSPPWGAHTRSVTVPLGWVYSFFVNYFLFRFAFVFTSNDARSQVT